MPRGGAAAATDTDTGPARRGLAASAERASRRAGRRDGPPGGVWDVSCRTPAVWTVNQEVLATLLQELSMTGSRLSAGPLRLQVRSEHSAFSFDTQNAPFMDLIREMYHLGM